MEMFVVDATCRAFHKTVPFIKWLIIWSRTDKQLESYSHCNRKPCNCHFDTEHLIRISFSLFFYFQLTTLQAHTMAPMNLFCTRFLKSLLVKEDSTAKPQQSQSDDDEDEQMHSDDDWSYFKTHEKTIVNKLKSIDDWHF